MSNENEKKNQDNQPIKNPTKTKKKNKNKDIEKTKKYKIKTKKHPKVRKFIKITLLTILLIIIIAAGIIAGKVYGIFKSAKLSMEQIGIKYENTILIDSEGNVIGELTGDENRKVIKLNDMSEYVRKAFVAIEDERFYDHEGVDIKRTASATFKYALSKIGIGKANYGGSTITQQLIKNLTKEDERTAERKIQEMARAHYLEKELSKDQILELYLNLIFLGDRASGVEVASNYYFSKNAKDLTLIESAFLAGINDGPNYYHPFSEEQGDKDKIKRRVKVVLDKMYELNSSDSKFKDKFSITKEEHDAAIKELEETGIVFTKGTIANNNYSYHTEAAIKQVKKELRELHPDWTEEYTDLYVKSGGLTIYTTQNTTFQHIMEEEVKKDKYIVKSKYQTDADGNYVTAQTAMVLMNHKNGQVLATVGGIGEKTTTFGWNRATQMTRSSGSSIKPLAVVAPGIDKGIITAATVFDDISYSSGQYSTFKNYGFVYKGLITVRYAIAASQNIPMLKGINRIGIQTSMDFLKSAGITTLDDEKDAQMSLTLGGMTNGVTPLEMAGAYSAIANDGVYIEPTFYTKVVDSEGKEVLVSKQEKRTIMSSAAAYVVKEILTEVVRSGAGGYAAIPGISVGVKTGTSQSDVDRWFCGFTPYYTAATWFGFDNDSKEAVGTKEIEGKGPETVVYPGNANPSGKIWDGVMEQIHEGLPAAKFSDTRPNGVTTRQVCKSSGLLATDLCANDPRGNQVYTEYFVKGTEPSTTCTCHVQVEICNDTGLLANEYCPNKTSKVFITRDPGETGNWQRAADAEYMLTITETCTEHTKPEEKPPVEEPPIEEPPKTNENTTNENTSSGGNTTPEPPANNTTEPQPPENNTNTNTIPEPPVNNIPEPPPAENNTGGA